VSPQKKTETWTCSMCKRQEAVLKTTDGKRFVTHICKAYGGTLPQKKIGQMKRVKNLGDIEITIYPGEYGK